MSASKRMLDSRKVAHKDAQGRVMWALRMTEEEREAIRKRAHKAKLSMGAYMIKAALGELAVHGTTEERFQSLEARLERVERAVNLGGYG